ncbi:hypothetical protein BGX24_000449 [Mortierella sp. AD032]|nr:hypothetical protein BGX24_000449 [Mortierella sp. AD032]
MITSPDSQTSPPTPKQDGVEDEKFSPGNPKQLRGAIPSVPQALPATPMPDHCGDDVAETSSDEDVTESNADDDAAESDSAEDATESISAKDATESNSAEDVNTKTETGSEVQIQGQVQPQDQDQAEPSNPTISERSKEPMVREEDEKPSSGSKVKIEQEQEISHGPLTANRPSDDDKEPIKRDSLAGVNAEEEEEEEEETVYCNVIGSTTRHPCKIPASECSYHQGQEVIRCNATTGAGHPCKIPASECSYHQGPKALRCNATTRAGHPCKIPASECRYH